MAFVDNKRIAKNTLLLYIRMLLLMAVSLYTSRVILDVLGVDDYGTYNLVGGFVTLFSFISGALVATMQRFFNVALGLNNSEQFLRIYSMGINIFILFSIILLLIGETVGFWFVSTQLNLPDGRLSAAIWVYQISLITFIVNLFRTPDNASIIAYEHMNFYAYISIGEAILKLLIVFILQICDTDKLILYSCLYLGITIIVNIAYKVYCNIKFNACRYKFFWDSKLFKELMSFSGWNLLMQGSMITKTQTESFLTNHYFSISINASRGIASQVYNAINLFLVNFQTAFKPQLVKSYVAGEMDAHYNLIYRSSKFSFYLLLLIVIPIVFNMDIILKVWLSVVPPYTKEFCIYILMAYLFDALGAPLSTSVYANGRIKGLIIISSIIFIIGIVISFFALRAGFVPYITAIITLILHGILFLIYAFYAKRLCDISIKGFFKKVIIPAVIVFTISIIPPLILSQYSIDFGRAIMISLVDIIWVLVVIFTLGLKKNERNMIVSKLLKKH